MKPFASFLFLVAFAVAAPIHGQTNTDDLNSMSGIKRPSARPAPSAAAAGGKTATGPKKPLEATLTKDKEGKSPATTFAASDANVYLQWKDASATKGDKLRVVWVAEDVTGIATKNKKLTEATQTLPGPGAFGDFYLPATGGGFPVGKYRVELYEAGKLAKSLGFTVKK